MRKKLWRGFKIVFRVIAVMVFLLMVVVIVYSFKGYRMYQDATKDTPVSKTVDTIRGMKHFTKYKELPPIYIDAVISAEDKRFFSIRA